ncbi:MAG: exodeoxyribonuclease VII small subunit [Clostridium argentinense]|uniref:Exodeoxyribonuclease 7 small subunit n=1 Tax=Clostridium faecium TaxID=2762223 RepID=A0ABR8YW43_9CLOT|nr:MULTISPECIES: exodeoxyribonuclease VII small subunit [Clostridium]MBD8048394.1 exodeoxyribonuclease VII small subunit [Clostridium faecium]MBS5823233.1 exodeoxyribonuclease VII small subunit [Clostridium argentinense]MDU1349027.1 exodeoxyribonuclease VII small subunit [Clostridium argentinense]
MARKKESYEDKLMKLTEIISKMESSELTLEDSMKEYESGIKLCNELYKMLNEYEGKIKLLSNDEEKDFNLEEIE